ncbi:uncharacterized protein CTRU02_212507 [Colletotrichum truncatum]|uniref:Uncharacterized protein n=1 Tax=Colletotrichum truncatum TaxID=5467 RepID=A0ACC3YNR1_COLTU|nr:uncharacterized protein CTRU02_05679 [Colletotrichum truncatum]KAF6794122.1 hypothetical protein CTRU02_05679 [Colletotrichum truncatum]
MEQGPRRSGRLRAAETAKSLKAAKAPTAPEPPTVPEPQAKKAYSSKKRKVASDLEGNKGHYSENAQWLIDQMLLDAKQKQAEATQRADQNAADAEAWRNLQKNVVSEERDDDDFDPDEMSLDEMSLNEWDNEPVENVKTEANAKTEAKVKTEPSDIGIFVPRKAEKTVPIIVANDENSNGDDDYGDVVLVEWNDIVSVNTGGNCTDKGKRIHGYLNAGWNRYYKVIGLGPRHYEKLEFEVSHNAGEREGLTNLMKTRKALEDEKKNKIIVDGVKLKVDIQGVAWSTSQNTDDPVALMDPRYWEKMKSESKGKPKKFPFTSVYLKWTTTHADGDPTVERTFETRSTVRSIFGRHPRPAPMDYMIGSRVVLKKGTMMPAGDLAIFAAAIISLDRYEKWQETEKVKEEGEGGDRDYWKEPSPAPDELLRPNKPTRITKKGAK